MNTCPFCNQINERVYFDSLYSKVLLAKHAIYSGQSLVIPKRHLEQIDDLTDLEIADLALSTKKAIQILQITYGVKDFNIVLNHGKNAGQTVSHLHYHIIPRIQNDIKDPKLWLNSDLFDLLKENSELEMQKECEKIKSHMNVILENEINANFKKSAIASTVKIIGEVNIGENCVIEDNVILGHVPSKKNSDLKLIIGANSIIRSGTVIYSGARIGDNFDCGHNVLIREQSIIGNNVYLYPSTQIHVNVNVGNNSRISGWVGNHSVIKNNVSCFGQLVHEYKEREGGHIEPAPIVSDGAMVGWNAILIGGIIIGENATVGAGAIVTKNVLPNEIFK